VADLVRVYFLLVPPEHSRRDFEDSWALEGGASWSGHELAQSFSFWRLIVTRDCRHVTNGLRRRRKESVSLKSSQSGESSIALSKTSSFMT
jgi:hypothetical protein